MFCAECGKLTPAEARKLLESYREMFFGPFDCYDVVAGQSSQLGYTGLRQSLLQPKLPPNAPKIRVRSFLTMGIEAEEGGGYR